MSASSAASIVRVLGVSFDALSEAAVVDTVRQRLREGRGGVIVTPNTSIMRQARNRELAALINGCDLVLCDGAPVHLASILSGSPVPQRVTGASLIHTLSEMAAQTGRSVYLLGGEGESAFLAADALASRWAGLRVAGCSAPPHGFQDDSEKVEALIRGVVDAAPDVVFVGLGFPKQEKLAAQLLAEMPNAWSVCCGAAIEFAAGTKRRAPRNIQRWGLEWLYRLCAEPSRLGRRYAADAVYLPVMLGQAALQRLRRVSAGAPK